MGRLVWIITTRKIIPFRRISTLSKKQVLGSWKMNVIALTMAIFGLFVMNLEISFAELKEREVSMMGIGEAPDLRSIEREEPATRSDEPGEGGVEDRIWGRYYHNKYYGR